MKEYKNIRSLVVNIQQKNGEPEMLASVPDGGVVKEYDDRYEWEVTHHQGMSLMKAYKRDIVTVELLY